MVSCENAEKGRIRILALIIAFTAFIILITPVSAFLYGRAYYREITITNNINQALTDYQVVITLDTQTLISQGKMRSDCGDIRITDLNGNQLPYWVRNCNQTNTEIWTKIPSIPASSQTKIYLWYGNSSATSQSNGEAVFEWFDDASTNKTSSYVLRDVYPSGNPCSFNYDSTNKRYVFSITSSDNCALTIANRVFSNAEIEINFITPNTLSSNYYFGATVRYSSSGLYYVVACNYFSPDRIRWIYEPNPPSYPSALTETSFSGNVISANTQYIFIARAYSTNLYAWTSLESKSLTASHTALSSGEYGIFFGSDPGSVYFNFVMIRKYVDPEPSVVVGSERAGIFLDYVLLTRTATGYNVSFSVNSSAPNTNTTAIASIYYRTQLNTSFSLHGNMSVTAGNYSYDLNVNVDAIEVRVDLVINNVTTDSKTALYDSIPPAVSNITVSTTATSIIVNTTLSDNWLIVKYKILLNNKTMIDKNITPVSMANISESISINEAITVNVVEVIAYDIMNNSNSNSTSFILLLRMKIYDEFSGAELSNCSFSALEINQDYSLGNEWINNTPSFQPNKKYYVLFSCPNYYPRAQIFESTNVSKNVSIYLPPANKSFYVTLVVYDPTGAFYQLGSRVFIMRNGSELDVRFLDTNHAAMMPLLLDKLYLVGVKNDKDTRIVGYITATADRITLYINQLNFTTQHHAAIAWNCTKTDIIKCNWTTLAGNTSLAVMTIYNASGNIVANYTADTPDGSFTFLGPKDVYRVEFRVYNDLQNVSYSFQIFDWKPSEQPMITPVYLTTNQTNQSAAIPAFDIKSVPSEYRLLLFSGLAVIVAMFFRRTNAPVGLALSLSILALSVALGFVDLSANLLVVLALIVGLSFIEIEREKGI